MAVFAKNLGRPANPRRAPNAAVEAPINRGTLPVASVGSSQAADQGLDLSRIKFDRSAFVFDGTVWTGSVRAQDAVDPAVRWSRVATTSQLRAVIGPTDVELYVYVWGQFAWQNDSGQSAGAARVTAGLFTSLAATTPYLWAENSSYQFKDNANHYEPHSFIGRFQVPIVDAADWSVGLMCQYNSGGTRTSQRIYAQSLMTLVGSYPADGEAGAGSDLLPDGD